MNEDDPTKYCTHTLTHTRTRVYHMSSHERMYVLYIHIFIFGPDEDIFELHRHLIIYTVLNTDSVDTCTPYVV